MSTEGRLIFEPTTRLVIPILHLDNCRVPKKKIKQTLIFLQIFNFLSKNIQNLMKELQILMKNAKIFHNFFKFF